MSREIAAIRDIDLRMVELYKDFLPKQVFDTHIHMYAQGTIPGFFGVVGTFFREEVTPEDYCSDLMQLIPGVEQIRLNMMPMVDASFRDLSLGTRDKANRYVSDLTLSHPQHVASAYVRYHDDEQTIGDMVSLPGVKALKCYYYTSKGDMNADCSVADFLPESAWVVANEKKLPIILHLMRGSGLSDAENFSQIMEMTGKYPDAKLVLAHCARGFVSWTMLEQVRKLVNRDNIWFDMAAVCEVGPIMSAIMHSAGKRITWGTDWPICLRRGRAISIGDSQLWISETPEKRTPYALLVAESLHAFHQTAVLMGLDQTQVDDIFYHNAVNLFDCK